MRRTTLRLRVCDKIHPAGKCPGNEKGCGGYIHPPVNNHLINKPINRSIERSIIPLFNESIDRPVNQHINQSVHCSISQPVIQSTNQFINQSTHRPLRFATTWTEQLDVFHRPRSVNHFPEDHVLVVEPWGLLASSSSSTKQQHYHAGGNYEMFTSLSVLYRLCFLF